MLWRWQNSFFRYTCLVVWENHITMSISGFFWILYYRPSPLTHRSSCRLRKAWIVLCMHRSVLVFLSVCLFCVWVCSLFVCVQESVWVCVSVCLSLCLCVSVLICTWYYSDNHITMFRCNAAGGVRSGRVERWGDFADLWWSAQESGLTMVLEHPSFYWVSLCFNPDYSTSILS